MKKKPGLAHFLKKSYFAVSNEKPWLVELKNKTVGLWKLIPSIKRVNHFTFDPFGLLMTTPGVGFSSLKAMSSYLQI